MLKLSEGVAESTPSSPARPIAQFCTSDVRKGCFSALSDPKRGKCYLFNGEKRLIGKNGPAAARRNTRDRGPERAESTSPAESRSRSRAPAYTLHRARLDAGCPGCRIATYIVETASSTEPDKQRMHRIRTDTERTARNARLFNGIISYWIA